MIASIYISLAIYAIVFLQSGLDKIIQYRGELEFLKSHFGSSFLKSGVPILFPVLILLELGSGITAIIALVDVYLNQSFDWAICSMGLSTLSLLSLLFGQRVARDYPGAQSIIIYLIPAILFWICMDLV